MKVNAKFAVQVLVVVLGVVFASYAENPAMTPTEWTNVLVLALGAVAVYCSTNLDAGVWAYTKTYIAAGSAGAVALSSVITDGISSPEWAQILVAVLGALGVFAAPGVRRNTTAVVI